MISTLTLNTQGEKKSKKQRLGFYEAMGQLLGIYGKFADEKGWLRVRVSESERRKSRDHQHWIGQKMLSEEHPTSAASSAKSANPPYEIMGMDCAGSLQTNQIPQTKIRLGTSTSTSSSLQYIACEPQFPLRTY